jgi:hypothetical protein
MSIAAYSLIKARATSEILLSLALVSSFRLAQGVRSPITIGTQFFWLAGAFSFKEAEILQNRRMAFCHHEGTLPRAISDLANIVLALGKLAAVRGEKVILLKRNENRCGSYSFLFTSLGRRLF